MPRPARRDACVGPARSRGSTKSWPTRGARVALNFAVPFWPGGGQALDVWVLDARTAKLSQVPGMPALVALKRTSIAWTDDARLVLLGESAGKEVVALWRPGQKRLAVKAVRLGRHSGYSDTFAPLR